MLSIIDDLLESAAIGLGKVELDLHSFDIVKVLENVCHHYGRVLEAKHQHLSIVTPTTCIIQGDEVRIRQVADNLLSNASKYSPHGSTITIILETIGEMVQIAVQDEGPGLTSDDKANLFGMFQRLSAQPTGGESSSGVGLASVKNIVELHGGTIDVLSSPGEGSTFIVRLPMIAG
jgi:signal transduction histidine kinase